MTTMKALQGCETGKKNMTRGRAFLLIALMAVMAVPLAPASTQAQSFGGAFEGMSNSDDPIQIEADRLEVQDGQGVALFEGNVSVVQGTTILKTRKLKVFYMRDGASQSPGGNVRKIEATGKVAVRSGDQTASADSAVVDMQAQIATLSGNVTVSQGTNILTGCNLRINMATNAANLTPCESAQTGSGRVKMLFTPNSNQ